MAERSEQERAALVLVALSAALAYLAHGSNVFALLALAVAFLPTIWRAGPAAITVATLAAVLVYLPWAYWQVAIQPGGNALLRYGFAGTFGFDQRHVPVLETVIEAYRQLGLEGWFALKLKAVRLLLGIDVAHFGVGEIARYSPGYELFGSARILDFLVVGRALAPAAPGLAALLIISVARRESVARSHLGLLRSALVVGVSGVVLTVLATMSDVVAHTQPYGSLVLLLLAGFSMVALAPPLLGAAFVFLVGAYAASVWIAAPLAVADRLHPSAFIGLALGVGLVLTAFTPVSMQPSSRNLCNAVSKCD
jgi:hypothetical protein